MPRWLPSAVVVLREWIFTRVNGVEGIPVPGPLVGAEHFERVYADPAADGRSRGAGLSDLFWYWLAPGPQMHQEHLEPGERLPQRGEDDPAGARRAPRALRGAGDGRHPAPARRRCRPAGPSTRDCAT